MTDVRYSERYKLINHTRPAKQCPFCGAWMDWEDDHYFCDNDDCLYPRIEGIPELHKALEGIDNAQADRILATVVTALLDMREITEQSAIENVDMAAMLREGARC